MYGCMHACGKEMRYLSKITPPAYSFEKWIHGCYFELTTETILTLKSAIVCVVCVLREKEQESINLEFGSEDLVFSNWN